MNFGKADRDEKAKEVDPLVQALIAKPFVEFIRSANLSCADVSDAMGKIDVINHLNQPSPLPLIGGLIKVGVCWQLVVKGDEEGRIVSNWQLHEDLAEQDLRGSVLYVCSAYNDIDPGTAFFGHLVSKYVIQHLNAEAVVVNGAIRDTKRIVDDKLPVWAMSKTPLGKFQQNLEKTPGRDRPYLTGSVMVCDDDGVVFIPKEWQTQNLFDKLKKIAEREKSWYEELARGKSTFEITCLREVT